MASTRSKVAKKTRSNATLSMKDLTEKEKKAEKASAQRRANRAAGNAGLSSQRLNRLEAEAERKSAEKREANKSNQKSKTPPREGSRRAAVAERRALTGSGTNLRADASSRISPPDVKGKGSMEKIKGMAKKLAPAARTGARFLGPAGVVYTAFELLDMMPDSAKKSQAGQKNVTGGRSKAARTKTDKPKEKSKTSTTKSKSTAKPTGSTSGSDRQLIKKAEARKKTGDEKYRHGKSAGGVSFGEAFKYWKGKGNKTFTWNGKKYTTETK